MIFATREKCKNFDLEIEGLGQGVEKRNMRHLSGDVRSLVGKFFRILTTWQHLLELHRI